MKNQFILILAVTAFALLSCQNEKLEVRTESPANEISLKSATISSKSAINGTTFPAGYGMLVSAYRNKETGGATNAHDDVSGSYFEGITFRKGTTSTWVAETPKYWPLNGTLDFLCLASAGINKDSLGVKPTTCTWGKDNVVARKVEAIIPANTSKFDDILYGSALKQTYQQTGTPVKFNHAGSVVAFLAKSTVPYDKDKNLGITITEIFIDSLKANGKLTVTEARAGKETPAAGDTLTAAWDFTGVDDSLKVKARVWNSTNDGIKIDEPALDSLSLAATYSDSLVNSTKYFGDAYVILPPQPARSFTIKYTIHNGFKDDGITKVDNPGLLYRYYPAGQTWEMGKKTVYKINITLHQIEIKPEVFDWTADFKEVNIE